MGDFEEFRKQGLQLSNIMNGPSKIPDKFLKGLWDASEGGDPSRRVERAVNQLMVHLEKGDVPDDGSDAGGPVAKKHSSHKHKKDKKHKKDHHHDPQGEWAHASDAFGGLAKQHQPHRDTFDTLDTNHDGVIDPLEWAAHGGELGSFNAIDKNHDGHITRREWKAADRAHADAHAESETDSDHDWWRQPAAPSAGGFGGGFGGGGCGGGGFGGGWGGGW
mmetsp:Transcript_43500/g.124672  ORF Transcript_43500/g.124672 Transcript_43500/m.124672 type:complete len:219 (-) Transcript_43500:170-826(-)